MEIVIVVGAALLFFFVLSLNSQHKEDERVSSILRAQAEELGEAQKNGKGDEKAKGDQLNRYCL